MINFTPRLDKAIRIAAWAHNQQPQYRKGTDIPYVVHPYGVMLIASNVTDDEDILISCLLHDVLEDVAPEVYSDTDMLKDFGGNAVAIVKGVSKDDSIKNWQPRSEAYLAHLENEAPLDSVTVSCADKIHNLMSILSDYEVMGEDVWSKFNAGKAHQQWWYREVLAVVKRRNPQLPLIKDLSDLVTELEKL